MLEIYILTGGEIFYQIINAIAAFFNSSSWGMLVRWSLNVAILGGMIRYIGTNDLIKLLRWVFIYIFILSVLVVPKKTVQIIDLSDRLSVYKVDNVPLGVAILFSFSTKVGFGIAEMYDQFFSVPDAVAYSKTGFLFGANLAKDSIYASLPNSKLTENLNNYVTNCVIGDIMLNHKYSLDELMDSTNTLELITSNASPIRRMIYKGQGNSKQNISCKDGANSIKNDLTSVFSQGGSIVGTLNRIIYSDKVAKEMALKELLQESYYFFHRSSKSAVDILKHNVTNNAVRKGINSFAGKQGDVAGIIAVSAENSQLKSRLNWAVSSQIATTYLPMLHTVMLLLLFGLFPVVIMLTVSDVMGIRPLQLYALSLVYFMSWLPLYSILNYIMVYYTKSSLNGIDVTLNNTDKIKLIHSDIGMISGYLSLSIPFLALGIVKGFSTVATNASNFLSASISGAISQVSSSASDGNWNIGNMSTENVQGFKWDTNYNYSSGNMSQQLSNGAISTMSADGTSGINTSAIQSYLATTGSISKSVSAQYAESIRYAESMVTNSQRGMNESSRNLFNSLTQLQHVVNSGGNYTKGYNKDEIASVKKDLDEMFSTAKQYAKQNNMSIQEAANYLNYQRREGSIGLGGSLGVGNKVANVSLSLGFSGADGSNDNFNQTSSDNDNMSRNVNNDLVRKWAYHMDHLRSYRLTYNGSETENYNQGLIDNINTSYENGIASTNAYNESKSVLFNLNRDKNEITSGNSTITSNLNNEFVKWLQKEDPINAQKILSDTSNSEIARVREQKWEEFSHDYVKGRINNIISQTSSSFKEAYNKNSSEIKLSTNLDEKYNKINENTSKEILENRRKIYDSQDTTKQKTDKIKNEFNFENGVNQDVLSGWENEQVDNFNKSQRQFEKRNMDVQGILDQSKQKQERFKKISENPINNWKDKK
jgi:conjugal transfer mating pair stabilization protein TraG